MLWCRTHSISRSPSQVCTDIFQIFLSKPSSLPQPCLQDKAWGLCFVVPANSLKDRAGECACSDTRQSASSTSQNQRRLKGHRWADSSSKWKDRREKASWEMHGGEICLACSSRPVGERGVQESPFMPNTVLLTFSPTDRAQLSPQSLSDLIEGTASWSRSAKLVASFAFPYHVTPKPFQTP